MIMTLQNNGSVKANETLAGVCAAACQRLLARIERARESVLAQFRGRLEANDQMTRLALKEAEALAWQTGYPQLFFPTLEAEKLQAVASWEAHQRSVRQLPYAA